VARLSSEGQKAREDGESRLRDDGDLVMGPSTTGRWSYACSKAIDEFLALAYWKERKLPTVVAPVQYRPGHGRPGATGWSCRRSLGSALAGRPLTLFGDGTQTRCFCHVGDVVTALVELMLLGDAAYGEVFNVGSQEEISIYGLAERVRDLTRSDSEIVVVPYHEAYEEGFEDMPRRFPDIVKIEAAVGWRPSHTLDAVLADVVTFQQAEAAVV